MHQQCIQLPHTAQLRELLLAKIKQLGWDPAIFGMHSLCTGGATAVANAGVPDRLFKSHGRWRSETAKDGYVKDSVEKRLGVSYGLVFPSFVHRNVAGRGRGNPLPTLLGCYGSISRLSLV